MFSGKKLTHLQRQVCTHILHGIQRETVRLKDEWEALLQLDQNDISGIDATSQEASYMNSRVSDSYCFELLSQVAMPISISDSYSIFSMLLAYRPVKSQEAF